MYKGHKPGRKLDPQSVNDTQVTDGREPTGSQDQMGFFVSPGRWSGLPEVEIERDVEGRGRVGEGSFTSANDEEAVQWPCHIDVSNAERGSA